MACLWALLCLLHVCLVLGVPTLYNPVKKCDCPQGIAGPPGNIGGSSFMSVKRTRGTGARGKREGE